MAAIGVWAPYADKVELFTDAQNHPMRRHQNAWWYSELELKHGSDYGFIIDGEGPFPDPRSRWQPHGVHGLSRVYEDHFAWQDQHWRRPAAEQAVIYELHLGTFSPQGTYQGLVEKLEHLVALGITHIELLPLAAYAGEHGWGYDGVSLFAPHPRYGTPDELKQLVNACHQAGLAVILDVVYNHLGPSGNYLSKFGPYFHNDYHTPWGQALNFDGNQSPEVRRFFIDNALMWLQDYHFDGLRLDAVQTIMDGSAMHFLEQLASEVDAQASADQAKPILIAESHMNDGRLMRPRHDGGYGLQAQWHDDFHHAIFAYLSTERAGYFQDYGSLEQIATVLNEGVYFAGQYCHYRQRLLGRPAEQLAGQNFVAYIQNHDQVGNRPGGERLSNLLNPGQCKIAAALLLCAPFIPMLFQGEEWGAQTPFYFFTDHQEAQLARAIKRGRKQEAEDFGWSLAGFSDPQDPRSFARSHLDWQELEAPAKQDLLQWYSRLLQLRARHQDLQAGPFLRGQAQADSQNQTLKMRRGAFEIICNFAATETRVETTLPQAQICAASEPGVALDQSTCTLAPYSVAILDNLSLALA